MDKSQRVRYEMLQRVSEFGTVHRDLFPEFSVGGQAFARVNRAVEQIETHSVSKLLAAKEGLRAKAGGRAAVTRWMKVIARTARGVLRGQPKAANKFQLPTRSSDNALLTTARAFFKEAQPIEDELIRHGLPATFLNDLREEADAFDVAIKGRHGGRAEVAAGQAGIRDALADGREAVQVLDGIVANALENDAVKFAAWLRNRRVIDGRPKEDDNVPAVATEVEDRPHEPVDPVRRAS